MREALLTIDDDALDAMGLGELVAYTRAAGIRDFEELACHGDGAVVQVEVGERLDGDRLSSFDAVDDWQLLAERPDAFRYLVEVTVDAPAALADRTEELVGTCDAELTDWGATLSLVGSQRLISETLRAYEAAGATPELEKLGDYEGERGTLAALTNRQREVVRTAYRMGYYDVPRGASTDEVAAELGVDPSTVSEHLQRAERNLLSERLATAD